MLEDLFSQPTALRVIRFLLNEPQYDFSKADVAKQTDATWKTISIVFPKLVRYQLVLPTRKIGRAQMFKVNRDSNVYQYIEKLALEMALQDSGNAA